MPLSLTLHLIPPRPPPPLRSSGGGSPGADCLEAGTATERYWTGYGSHQPPKRLQPQLKLLPQHQPHAPSLHPQPILWLNHRLCLHPDTERAQRAHQTMTMEILSLVTLDLQPVPVHTTKPLLHRLTTPGPPPQPRHPQRPTPSLPHPRPSQL